MWKNKQPGGVSATRPPLTRRILMKTQNKEQRPEFIETEEELEEYLEYLDELRDSGVTNMFGAGQYIQRDFGIDKRKANAVLTYWMHTFSERHPA